MVDGSFTERLLGALLGWSKGMASLLLHELGRGDFGVCDLSGIEET